MDLDVITDIHPSVIVGIIGLSALYIAGAIKSTNRVTRTQWFWFASTVALTFFTLGPVDEWAERRSFWMHMLQHFNQTFVIPPMLLMAVPAWMLRPWVLSRPIKPIAKIATNPFVAFFLFSGVFVMAHSQQVFDTMCRNEQVHIAIHLAFMVTGTLMWWPILSPLEELPPLSYPAQIFYLFLLMIPMTAVAAPITLAYSVVYPWYLEGPHPWGLTPMDDQVLGGLLMWIGQGTYLMLVFTAIFVRWQRTEDEVPTVAASSRPIRLVSSRPSRQSLKASGSR